MSFRFAGRLERKHCRPGRGSPLACFLPELRWGAEDGVFLGVPFPRPALKEEFEECFENWEPTSKCHLKAGAASCL